MSKPNKVVEVSEILQIEQATATMFALGVTPLIMNRMAEKATHQLLLPSRKKNRAELESTLKHDPVAEYRSSMYRCRDDDAPTLVHIPNGAFKKAMAQAAIDIPGATKAQIGRLVSIKDVTVHVYGVPQLYMAIVRQAGPQKTPDVRTRAIFPRWACKVTVSFIRNIVSEKDVLNLFSAAGMITGIGDGRTEKGSSDFGQWEVVGSQDSRWHSIVSKEGRKAQQAATDRPQAYDIDTEELLSWFEAEVVKVDKVRKLEQAPHMVVLASKNGKGESSNKTRHA